MHFILLSLIFLCSIIFLYIEKLSEIFLTNIHFNGFILFITIFGSFYTFINIYKLVNDKNKLEKFLQKKDRISKSYFIRELENVSYMGKDEYMDRIYNQISLPHLWHRYLIGILIMLGLLGTFWGLSNTISGVTKIISNMSDNNVIECIKNDLSLPLTGMSTAFSSSLFGLIGSLIIGFYDVIYQNLTEKVFLMIQESLKDLPKPTNYSGNSYNAQLLEFTIEKLASLEKTISKTTKYVLESLISTSNLLQKDISINQDEIRNILIKINNFQVDSISKVMEKAIIQEAKDREISVQEIKEEIRIISKILSKLISD